MVIVRICVAFEFGKREIQKSTELIDLSSYIDD